MSENHNVLSLTPSSISEIKHRISAIDRDLEPISENEARGALAVMLKAFGSVAGADDPALANLYLKATKNRETGEGHPRGAIMQLCEDIALGEIEGVSRDYPPKVPQFAQLCRVRAEGLRSILRNRQRELHPPAVLPAEPPRIAGPSLAEHEADLAKRREEVAAEARAREARVNADLAARRAERESSAVELPSDVEPETEAGSA